MKKGKGRARVIKAAQGRARVKKAAKGRAQVKKARGKGRANGANSRARVKAVIVKAATVIGKAKAIIAKTITVKVKAMEGVLVRLGRGPKGKVKAMKAATGKALIGKAEAVI